MNTGDSCISKEWTLRKDARKSAQKRSLFGNKLPTGLLSWTPHSLECPEMSDLGVGVTSTIVNVRLAGSSRRVRNLLLTCRSGNSKVGPAAASRCHWPCPASSRLSVSLGGLREEPFAAPEDLNTEPTRIAQISPRCRHLRFKIRLCPLPSPEVLLTRHPPVGLPQLVEDLPLLPIERGDLLLFLQVGSREGLDSIGCKMAVARLCVKPCGLRQRAAESQQPCRLSLPVRNVSRNSLRREFCRRTLSGNSQGKREQVTRCRPTGC